MSAHNILVQIQNSSPALLISKSDHLVGAALQVVHILGFLLLLSSLIVITLHRFGLAFRHRSVDVVSKQISALLWTGLTAAALSGILMFISAAVLYASKPIFLFKVGLFAGAVVLQAILSRRLLKPSTDTQRFAGSLAPLSLLLWFGVASAGRAIGFV